MRLLKLTMMFGLATVLLGGIATGCKKEPETAGEKLDAAIKATDAKADKAADELNKSMQDASKALGNDK